MSKRAEIESASSCEHGSVSTDAESIESVVVTSTATSNPPDSQHSISQVRKTLQPTTSYSSHTSGNTNKTMDAQATSDAAANVDRTDGEVKMENAVDAGEKEKEQAKTSRSKSKCSKHHKKSKDKKQKSVKKSSKKRAKEVSSESEDSSEDSSDEDDESEDDTPSTSEDERRKKKKKKSLSKRKSKTKAKAKSKSQKKHKKVVAESSSSESDDESDSSASDSSSTSSDDAAARRRKKSRKTSGKRQIRIEDLELEDLEEDESDDVAALEDQVVALMALINEKKMLAALPKSSKIIPPSTRRLKTSPPKTPIKQKRKSDAFAYKRVDQLWDNTVHNFKLKESAEDEEGEFAEYAFLVRRRFDWENKYLSTVIDIKSKQLRAVLTEVMKDCKSVSLEALEPVIDPNLLFLYLEHLRTYYRKTLKSKIKKEKKKKHIKKLEQQRALCKMLVSWIDEDYAETKKTLYPLLEAGNITFDLLWALFSPNDIAITSCYGVWDEPRCFKVDFALKYQSFGRGEWYGIEGKYMEFDGKSFGLGDFEVDIEAFKGPRKITSLAAYPLKYHKDADSMEKQLVARGEKFVALDGMHYKFHKGIAFMKKKRQALKISINSRIMVDPATFRRINPNYPISLIKAKDEDDLFDLDGSDDNCSCDGHDEGGDPEEKKLDANALDKPPKIKYKWVSDDKGNVNFVAVEVDENGDPIRNQNVDKIAETADGHKRVFTKEQLLITSPVVLGFSFSEKLWLEFSLSSLHDIVYNEDAFDSLVVPDKEKSIVRALVESHKFHAARTIDDVIQGKGKGLVTVLHGPPGVGKTLTAEGISELLKCPLYMVSAGELGTDPGRLEFELQKILDIAHSWGAVLLLDEADVFLEKRETHDIHRNALVSIFLRLLEYFQGILILTTNRVETFDTAFQSRIHLALHYPDLASKAKIAIWQTHLNRVRSSAAANAKESPAAPGTSATASTTTSTAAAKPEIAIDTTGSTTASTAPTSPIPTDPSSSVVSLASSITTTSTTKDPSTKESSAQKDAPQSEAAKAAAARSVTVTDADLVDLARHNLNGRQIKNAVRTAQALALHEGGQDAVLTLEHIRRVLEVQETFDRDLKGVGYVDAMRFYT